MDKEKLSVADRVTIRRAAFDIGSGQTKVQCSDYDGTKITNTLIGEERPVAFGADYLKSEDGCLSESIQLKGLSVLQELKEIAENCGASQFSAIATEVFRKAANGLQYLDRVRAIGIEVVILTQELEAKLGFASATITAGTDNESDDCCVWDSGGASFQICSRGESANTFRTYMGNLGSSVCCALLIREVQARSYENTVSPNPVSMEEASRLIELLQGHIGPVPAWLKDKDCVVAVTGQNSMFKVCCNVLIDSLGQGGDDSYCSRPTGVFRQDTLPGGHAISGFSADEAEGALRTCIGCTDDELCKYVNFKFSDGPKLVVPKLCLLVAVLRHTGIQRVETVMCIGSCTGLICEEQFWRHCEL